MSSVQVESRLAKILSEPSWTEVQIPCNHLIREKISLPKEEDFILIPESKNEIMKTRIVTRNVGKDPYRDSRNFINSFKILEKINELTEQNYRFPSWHEVSSTFYKSGNQDFIKSFIEKGIDYDIDNEWLNEIVIIEKDGSKKLIRDPQNVRLVDGEFRFKGGIEYPMELAEYDGYFDRVNEQGYPTTTTRGDEASEPSWWGGTRKEASINPVSVSNWLDNGLSLLARGTWECEARMRLVKEN